jgi:hemolysin activation/secretion protein
MSAPRLCDANPNDSSGFEIPIFEQGTPGAAVLAGPITALRELSRGSRHCLIALAGVALFIAGGADTVLAQPFPSTQPGQIINQPDLDERELRPGRDIITVPESEPGTGAGSDEKVFILQDVVLDGGSIYPTEELAPYAAAYIGQQVSFADLNSIARAITLHYRTDGYVLTQVVLPPQEIEDGVVHLQAVEGRITNVVIDGEYREWTGLIDKMANRITAGGTANTGDIERYLLLIDDLPGIRARGVIQPSDQPGGGTLVINVEQELLEGSISLDNRGSRFVGPYRGILVGAVNSWLGMHDRTTLRGIMTGFEGQTRELRFADMMQEFQIGSNGLRIRARGAVTETEPGGAVRPLRVQGESWAAEIQALYPLIRRRNFNINLLAGFKALESSSDLLGIEIANDRVRHFWGRAEVDFTDPIGGVTLVKAEMAQGAEILNQTDNGIGRSRANGEHKFTRFNGSLTRVQDLSHGISAKAQASGQYAVDPLLASEEFGVGGAVFGRAYDGAGIVGDSGIAGAFELRYSGPVPPKIIQSYQFYGFADIGTVYNRNRVAGERRQASIASAGGGVRFNLTGDISGTLEAAVPLGPDVASQGDHGNNVRVFFSILKRF